MEKIDASIVWRRDPETPTERRRAPRKPRKRDVLLEALLERVEAAERHTRYLEERLRTFSTFSASKSPAARENLNLFPPDAGIPD